MSSSDDENYINANYAADVLMQIKPEVIETNPPTEEPRDLCKSVNNLGTRIGHRS